jgi:hypothetical protein
MRSMSKSSDPSDQANEIEATLRSFAAKWERAESRRHGTIAFRLHGQSGGYYVHSAKEGCSVSREAGTRGNDFEILASPQGLVAVLSGGKDAREQFIEDCTKSPRPRVRGDLPYLRKVFRETGLMR